MLKAASHGQKTQVLHDMQTLQMIATYTEDDVAVKGSPAINGARPHHLINHLMTGNTTLLHISNTQWWVATGGHRGLGYARGWGQARGVGQVIPGGMVTLGGLVT